MAHAAQDVGRDQTDLQRLIQGAVEEVLPVCQLRCRSMPKCLCDNNWAKEYNERHDLRDPRYDRSGTATTFPCSCTAAWTRVCSQAWNEPLPAWSDRCFEGQFAPHWRPQVPNSSQGPLRPNGRPGLLYDKRVSQDKPVVGHVDRGVGEPPTSNNK